ncbi:RagB/SusD family nutrient uptake outer membrane protein [Maribacter algarum]|uniref:RagB/SusD family nutrient uptake outer membrane protein n=1 Tax=Maribacter algarum (ex Zhang et al. 2020) TaxID=2578118 RepID=A0A5S3QKP4_9FLAO|nr:RagB/SusD family nutrient uptake outer membrane protein [Maribacter algarum]TMM58414.1 RagB/SusD family nutrient uptake outer membrane protein [Maribacter algarum]
MNKKIYITLVIAIALLTKSCDKFIEEELVTDVSAASYYTTEAGFEDAVRATYATLKPFYGQEIGAAMTTFGTDIWQNGADGGHKVFNFYDGGLNGSESYIPQSWDNWYKGINQANGVINRSADVEMDEAQKTLRLAEVRFLRAFYYFHIVTTWGDAHLSLEETVGIEVEANRTSQSEIYTQAIVPDLEFAISNLPDEQSDYGRATKAAAEFLLGKVLLTRSYKSFADGTDASRAETLFGNVINNYGFSLLDNFADLWDITNQENSEMVFVVPNSKSQVDSGVDPFGHRWHLYFLQEYDVRRGMTRDIANGRPWKRHRPTDFMLTLWDRDVDSRYDDSFKHVWFANKDEPATDAVGDEPARAALAIGDSAIFIPGPGKNVDWPQSRQDGVPYLVITNDEYTERLFPSMNKWIDPTRPDRQKTQGQRDFILMRLGDAYLLRAEARLAQNNTTGASEDINVIRMRSAVPGQEAASQITPADVTLDFLLDERARELVGEGHRWWDLVRTGKLVERTRLHNTGAAPNIQDYHTVRPIPQNQIDRTLGGYPQNPGYPQ